MKRFCCLLFVTAILAIFSGCSQGTEKEGVIFFLSGTEGEEAGDWKGYGQTKEAIYTVIILDDDGKSQIGQKVKLTILNE